MNRFVSDCLLFLFSHRFLAIARWELHFLWQRFYNAVSLQRLRIKRFVATRTPPLFLNLGSGPRGLNDPSWVNVDGFHDNNVQYEFDISRRLPFRDKSFDGIFCEHVLEHFSLEDGERIAHEIFRILRPGGGLRVVVPDAELILQGYFSNPSEIAAWRGIGHKNETPMEVVNSYFRQRYEHQFLYDWVTMAAMLHRAGFSKVERASFGAAALHPRLVLDAPKYERESLYVEASRK